MILRNHIPRNLNARSNLDSPYQTPHKDFSLKDEQLSLTKWVLQKPLSRIFFLNSLLTILWIMRVYIIWVKRIRVTLKIPAVQGCSQVGSGRVCAQPGLDPNDSSGGKYDPKPTQMIWLDFSVRVLLVSGYVGSVSSFIARADIWLNPARFGRNLSGFGLDLVE